MSSWNNVFIWIILDIELFSEVFRRLRHNSFMYRGKSCKGCKLVDREGLGLLEEGKYNISPASDYIWTAPWPQFWPENFFDPKTFWPENFLTQKIFWPENFFDPKYSVPACFMSKSMYIYVHHRSMWTIDLCGPRAYFCRDCRCSPKSDHKTTTRFWHYRN